MNEFHRRGFFRVATGAILSSELINPAVTLAAQAGNLYSVTLPIASRLQWDEWNGYCGECMVQQAALFYGTYVSQWVCRGIINRNQNSQLLVSVNAQRVLKALRLTSVEFDFQNQPHPQFKAYFVWIKQHLQAQHPVIITTYVQGLGDSDYDHIMLATGFSSTDSTTHHPTDQLFFNDGYAQTTSVRTASSLFDTRAMQGNGLRNQYCLPVNTDYGCAVTGIVDTSHAALPVQLHVDRWNEPDLIAGEPPVVLDGTVSVHGLIPGKSYALYRYNSYRTVPTINYSRSSYASVTRFVATNASATYSVRIPSDGIAIFRCLPAGL